MSAHRTTLSRRGFLAAAGTAAAGIALTSCAAPASRGATEITFNISKPEVIGYFRDLIARFHDEQSAVRVTLDSATNLSAAFARNSPPDLGCLNYNLEMARFMERGALSDLADLPEAGRITPEVAELVDQYATYPGRTSVLPYSMMAASVLYNRSIFDEHGLAVPETWTELLDVCEALSAAGVTPIYSTFADAWTAAQGIFDYTVGGSIDVAAFFDELARLGVDVGPDSPVSFQRTLAEPVERLRQLVGYTNADAPSRTYGDGNLAFGRGDAAMYLQGPWALNEIAKTAPDADIGAFPLPMTEDPADRRVRVNIDLALWIPEASPRQDAARAFLQFLMRPDVQDAYNADNLAFGVTTDAPPVTDERLVELQRYTDRAAFYQGPSKAVPLTIPLENYAQGIALGQDHDRILRTLDADWARLALRS